MLLACSYHKNTIPIKEINLRRFELLANLVPLIVGIIATIFSHKNMGLNIGLLSSSSMFVIDGCHFLYKSKKIHSEGSIIELSVQFNKVLEDNNNKSEISTFSNLKFLGHQDKIQEQLALDLEKAKSRVAEERREKMLKSLRN